jgi:CDP-diglyceride synthetase
VSFADNVKTIVRAVAGTLIALVGFFFIWIYLKPPAHVIQPSVVYALVALVAFGCVLVDQDLVIGIFKRLLDVWRAFKATPPAAP